MWNDETVAPPRHVGKRHRHLDAAVPSAPVHDKEGERALAKVENRPSDDDDFCGYSRPDAMLSCIPNKRC
jgi:hypothetical protein